VNTITFPLLADPPGFRSPSSHRRRSLELHDYCLPDRLRRSTDPLKRKRLSASVARIPSDAGDYSPALRGTLRMPASSNGSTQCQNDPDFSPFQKNARRRAAALPNSPSTGHESTRDRPSRSLDQTNRSCLRSICSSQIAVKSEALPVKSRTTQYRWVNISNANHCSILLANFAAPKSTHLPTAGIRYPSAICCERTFLGNSTP